MSNHHGSNIAGYVRRLRQGKWEYGYRVFDNHFPQGTCKTWALAKPRSVAAAEAHRQKHAALVASQPDPQRYAAKRQRLLVGRMSKGAETYAPPT